MPIIYTGAAPPPILETSDYITFYPATRLILDSDLFLPLAASFLYSFSIDTTLRFNKAIHITRKQIGKHRTVTGWKRMYQEKLAAGQSRALEEE